MIKSKTESGFNFEIDDERLDDYELFELLCEIDGGNSAKLPKVIRSLLGEEQEMKLKEHVRNHAGKVTISAMVSEIMAIMNACKKGKKS